jgi:regulation of enolase protein 1 (concanavalin A-like superfamily)
MSTHKPCFAAASLLLGLVTLCHLFSAWHNVAPVAKAQDAGPRPKSVAVDEKTIRDLITQLGDESFEKRDEAQKRLLKVGGPALELLRKAAETSMDLEVRTRAAEIERQVVGSALTEKQWGEVLDPRGDCIFRVLGNRLHIKLSGQPHRLDAEAGVVDAPRVLREIEGDFHADVTVLGKLPDDTRSLLGGFAWYGAGLLVWQDDKYYIRLDRAHMHFNTGKWVYYPSWELRRNGKVWRGGLWEDGDLDPEKPVHFRLDRIGKRFTAAFKQDGKDWEELGPINTDFGKKVKVGVAAAQNTAAVFEPIFENLKVTPGKR